jgi:hypothetical protein
MKTSLPTLILTLINLIFLDKARIYLPCGLGPNNFENIVKLITLVME